ncbi:MAG: type II toxin-antitoxin system VapC family toxin [Verrucomicrobiales bacterium]|jgi:predicted nucleic acid-binding protein|nr:type II toxin-antitoxin system VapC family toxin [Verrucomicrobiales bacterium]
MSNELVLDSSAALSWIFMDEATPESDRLHERLADGARAWVPTLWHLEICNVLLTAVRRQRTTMEKAKDFFIRMQAFDINVDPDTMTNAWSQTHTLAIRHQLTAYDAAYDAAYLELALRRGLPLATKDEALTAAAQTVGVELCL